MSKTRRKRTSVERRPRDERPDHPPDERLLSFPSPPSPRLWLLILASIFLAAWIVTLAVVAWQAGG